MKLYSHCVTSKQFCGLPNASRFGVCALSTFFFITEKQSIKKFVVVGFEIAVYFKIAMIAFASLRPTKTQINFGKRRKFLIINLKQSLSNNNLNLLKIESNPSSDPTGLYHEEFFDGIKFLP